jgi:hypothetical protein
MLKLPMLQIRTGCCRGTFSDCFSILEMYRPADTSADTNPTTYGHCEATYRDGEGKEQRYDMGLLDISPCNATDDQGNWLHSPKEQ